MHSPFIGAYWGSRREGKEACAQRASDFFERIRHFPELDRWLKKGRSVKAARRVQVPLDASGILAFWKPERRDVDGSEIVDLGFSLSLWNGRDASLAIRCGLFAPAMSNSLVLYLGEVPEVNDQYLVVLRSLLDIVIEVWSPDSAVATSHQLIEERGGGNPRETKGWFNYSRADGRII